MIQSETMKALLLNGGPRKNGVVSQVLDHMADHLEKTMTVEYIYLYEKKIAPCIGCLKCRPDRSCVLPHDDAHVIAGLIGEADLLIVGTPTYWGNMTGPLKTLFDRCVPTFEYIDGFKIRKMQKGKNALIVTASSAPYPYNQLLSQSRGAVRSIKTVLRAGGYKILKTSNVALASEFDKKKSKVFHSVDLFLTKRSRSFL